MSEIVLSLTLVGVYLIGFSLFFRAVDTATQAFLIVFWPIFLVAAVCLETWDFIKGKWNERRAS
jgi:hypothetical protein